MSIRGASSLRHPFLDLCRKLESGHKEMEIIETYPSSSEIWDLAPLNHENEFLVSRPEEEVS